MRKALDVPVVLISLVDDTRQFFPRTAGLAQSRLTRRQAPLSHAFCQRVAKTGQPLLAANARASAETHTHPAFTDLGFVAYAAIPLDRRRRAHPRLTVRHRSRPSPMRHPRDRPVDRPRRGQLGEATPAHQP
ncbi:hypothetical protein [Cryptosporangium sp. NPDC048952]|uniref:hypothetical protein n=1 Tax=Cryptosporangium sp. NPDC048952 TaxID=3363961 RepID=UPI003710791D